MSLTLIRRPRDSDEDDPWIRADTWEELAGKLGVPAPETTLDDRIIVRWPGDRRETYARDEAPGLPDIIRAWAAYGYKWAVVSGTAAKPRQPRTPDPTFTED